MNDTLISVRSLGKTYGKRPWKKGFRALDDVDLDVLPDLSEDDLRELGLPVGARRRVQRALHGSRDGAPDDPAPSAPTNLRVVGE